MSVGAYPVYRESGIEWIGRLPEHWLVQRLKASILSCQNGVWGDEPAGDENDIICVRVADFDRTALSVRLEEPTIRNVGVRDRETRLVRFGDLLIEKSGGGERQPVGAVVIYNQSRSAICSNFVARIELAAGMNASFWRYVHAAAYAARITVASIKQTSGIQNLDQQAYFNELAPFPSLAEQSAIASFLDRETGKIDALVAEQERLIGLLKEKRQAVISQAVTKGLDPNVPMKDSGVEWLGEVPVHWEIAPVWLLFELGRGRVISHEEIAAKSGDYPVYSSQTEDDGEMGRIDTFDFDGDYLTWTTDGANAGTVFLRAGKFNCTNVCGTMKAKRERLTLSYMVHAVQSGTASFVRQDINPKLMNNVMAGIRVPVPSSAEQYDIARHVRSSVSTINALAIEANRAIDLLRERRAALISAAVTGKIDVRDHADAEQAAA